MIWIKIQQLYITLLVEKNIQYVCFFFHLEDIVQKPLVKGLSFTPTVKVNALLNM